MSLCVGTAPRWTHGSHVSPIRQRCLTPYFSIIRPQVPPTITPHRAFQLPQCVHIHASLCYRLARTARDTGLALRLTKHYDPTPPKERKQRASFHDFPRKSNQTTSQPGVLPPYQDIQLEPGRQPKVTTGIKSHSYNESRKEDCVHLPELATAAAGARSTTSTPRSCVNSYKSYCEPGIAASHLSYTDTAHLSTKHALLSKSQLIVLSPRRLPYVFNHRLHQLALLISDEASLLQLQAKTACLERLVRVSVPADEVTLENWLNGPWTWSRANDVARLLVWTIVNSPQKLLRLLQVLETVDSDFHVRSSCLTLVGRIHKDTLLNNPQLLNEYDLEVHRLRSPSEWPENGLYPSELRLLIWRSDFPQAQRLVEDFLQKYSAPSLTNVLHLSMCCCENGMESVAASLLEALPATDLQNPSLLTLKCCHVLLRHEKVEVTNDGPNFKYLPRLLAKGLSPDAVLYSRIIEKALESGYPGVAWDVFRHLQSTKMEIHAWTYFLLMRHAFNAKNVDGVQELMAEIRRNHRLYASPILLIYSMNIVRRIFALEGGMRTSECLSHILALFDRVFDRKPLVKLGIVAQTEYHKPSAEKTAAAPDSTLTEPAGWILAATVWTYVLCHRHGKSVQRLWRRVQQLVEAGDPAILESMRDDSIYNAFIFMNLKHSETMPEALDVLQYMLTKQFCTPTDRTWSIIICGFLRHGQRLQAQQMFQLMRQYDMTMNDIRQEYWRKDWTMAFLEKNLDQILDEGLMPGGSESELEKILEPTLETESEPISAETWVGSVEYV